MRWFFCIWGFLIDHNFLRSYCKNATLEKHEVLLKPAHSTLQNGDGFVLHQLGVEDRHFAVFHPLSLQKWHLKSGVGYYHFVVRDSLGFWPWMILVCDFVEAVWWGFCWVFDLQLQNASPQLNQVNWTGYVQARKAAASLVDVVNQILMDKILPQDG